MFKLFFILIIFVGLIYRRCPQKCLRYLMFVLFLTVSLRHETCFVDTYSYILDYKQLATMDYSSIYKFWEKDISFWYVSKVISSFSNNNYSIWFASLAISYIIPLYFLIKKYSRNYQISLILFCCLGFGFFIMTGLRQTLAMGCTMGALYFLLKNQTKYYLLLVVLGALFHKTAIVFLILYPLINLPLKRKYILLYILLGGCIYYLSIQYLPTIIRSDFDTRFAAYVERDMTLNYSGLIRQILLFVLSLIFLGTERNNYFNRVFLRMSLVGIFFQSMTNMLPEMFRVSMYFSISNIFLLSNALTTKRQLPIVKYAVIIALIFYFITSKNAGFQEDYYFFFQDVPISVYNSLNY